jgi:hypothetical protein
MATATNLERESAWMSVRALALRDFSQDASLHAGAPTAIGTKSQPAGGIPMTPPPSLPRTARSMGTPEDLEDVEGPMRFGFNAALDAGPSGVEWNDTVEERLRVHWEQSIASRRDWEQVKPFIRHGWGYGRRHLGFGIYR